MIVAHNLMAMNAQRQFNMVGNKKAKSTEKLSSGYKINRAADDAAGLAISEKMRRQIRGLSQGTRNTQDGISLCQVADGALAEVDDMLHRITELSVKSANGTNTDSDRQAIQQEINQLLAEIDKIGDTAEFNEKKIFNGNDVQSGENSGVNGTAKIEGNKILSGGVIDVSSLAKLPAGQRYEISTTEQVILTGKNTDMSGFNVTVSGANIVLSGADIYTSDDVSIFEFTGTGNKITLAGTGGGLGRTKPGDYSTALINVPMGTELTIQGKGRYSSFLSLDSYGGNSGALIGGNKNESAGTIKLSSFQLTHAAAGKPGESYSDWENTNTAAIIGGGENGNGGKVIFEDVIAQLNHIGYGAIVGGGKNGNGGEFIFNGGQISYVTNSNESPLVKNKYGIGKGYNGSSNGNITDYSLNGSTFNVNGTVLAMSGDTDLTKKQIKDSENGNSGNNSIDAFDKKSWWIQSGAEAHVGMYLEIDNMNTKILGLYGLNVSTVSGANNAIDATKGALEKVSSNRSKIGAQQNRLEHTVRNNDNIVENTQAAESQIRDTDMAKEMVQNSMLEILSQAGISMMSQANQSNQGVLSLLQ